MIVIASWMNEWFIKFFYELYDGSILADCTTAEFSLE